MKAIRQGPLTISRRLRVLCSDEDLAALRQIVANSQSKHRTRRTLVGSYIRAIVNWIKEQQ